MLRSARGAHSIELASYNVENLFLLATGLNLETWQEGKPVLEALNQLNVVLAKERYTAADKMKVLGLLKELGRTPS